MTSTKNPLVYPLARLVLGLVALALAYGFISLAFASGYWWEYLLALIFLVLGVKNIVKLIGALFRGGQSRSAR